MLFIKERACTNTFVFFTVGYFCGHSAASGSKHYANLRMHAVKDDYQLEEKSGNARVYKESHKALKTL